MNFGLAFSYPFKDQEWPRKVLIPALIFLIPIVGQLYLMGWMVDIARRVIQHDETPLPEIDFGRQFVDGLKAFVVSFVYALPIIVLEIPIIIFSSTAGSGNNDQTLTGVGGILSICCGGLIFLYALVMAVLIPAALGNMAAKGTLSAGLNFAQTIALVRAAPGAYLLVLLGALVSGLIGSLGTVACFIGVLATTAYAMAVNGHLYGQAYNEATNNQGVSAGYARVY